MLDIFAAVLVTAVFIAVIWFYETQLMRLQHDLDAAYCVIADQQTSIEAQRQQLLDQQRLIAQPFDSHVDDALQAARPSTPDNVIPFPPTRRNQ